jgi:tetratricopeptide (TPR) repeat protein
MSVLNQSPVEDSPSRGISDLQQLAEIGIRLCRAGKWHEGLHQLEIVATHAHVDLLPGRVLAYLGYGIARYGEKYKQGLVLCKRAVEKEFYQPENFYYLAKTYLLLDDREPAIAVLERGLAVDPGSALLHRLRKEIYRRRRPVLPFLPRNNPLNFLLGKIRHLYLMQTNQLD